MAVSADLLTNNPIDARLFVQEKCGAPWVWVGAVTLRALQSDPVSLNYDRTVTVDGVLVQPLDRSADPTPFEVIFADNIQKWQSMHRQLIRKGCQPNMLAVNAKCKDVSRITDPTHNFNGAIMYQVRVASPYNYGNNTFITRDDNQSARREDSLQFVAADTRPVSEYRYLLGQTLPVASRKVVIIDEGACADAACRICGRDGCRVVVIDPGAAADIQYTLTGGAPYTAVTGLDGVPYNVFGRLFVVTPTTVRSTDDPSLPLASWGTAATTTAFAGLTSLAVIDRRTIVVGGTLGQIWLSSDGGSNFTRINPGGAGEQQIQDLIYNPTLKALFAIAGDATELANILISYDNGRTFTSISTAGTWGANSIAQLHIAGNQVFAVVNGTLYRLDCDADGLVDAFAISAMGTTVTGVGNCDDNCNNVFATTGGLAGAGIEAIYFTADGFATPPLRVTLPFALVDSAQIANPITCCKGRYGTDTWITFSTQVVIVRDWDSFFVAGS